MGRLEMSKPRTDGSAHYLCHSDFSCWSRASDSYKQEKGTNSRTVGLTAISLPEQDLFLLGSLLNHIPTPEPPGCFSKCHTGLPVDVLMRASPHNYCAQAFSRSLVHAACYTQHNRPLESSPSCPLAHSRGGVFAECSSPGGFSLSRSQETTHPSPHSMSKQTLWGQGVSAQEEMMNWIKPQAHQPVRPGQSS